MQHIGTFEGAEIYTAPDLLVLREHGGGVELELTKAIAKFERSHGRKPTVILSAEQLERFDAQKIEAARQTAAAEARAAAKRAAKGEPEPAEELEPDLAE